MLSGIFSRLADLSAAFLLLFGCGEEPDEPTTEESPQRGRGVPVRLDARTAALDLLLGSDFPRDLTPEEAHLLPAATLRFAGEPAQLDGGEAASPMSKARGRGLRLPPGRRVALVGEVRESAPGQLVLDRLRLVAFSDSREAKLGAANAGEPSRIEAPAPPPEASREVARKLPERAALAPR
jgi:hypothetical protein